MSSDRDSLPDQDDWGGELPPLQMERVVVTNRYVHENTHAAVVSERDRLRAENERLRRENATMRWQMSAADVPCGCKQTCGDDGDIDGPGTCKDLPMKREPLVELITVRRSALTSDEEKASDAV